MKKELYPDLNLVWEDWNDTYDKNNPPDMLWDNSSRFSEDFQQEVKSLMKEEYETYLAKYPSLRKRRTTYLE